MTAQVFFVNNFSGKDPHLNAVEGTVLDSLLPDHILLFGTVKYINKLAF